MTIVCSLCGGNHMRVECPTDGHQKAPNVHKILEAIRELEKHPAVKAYIALLRALELAK